MAATVANAANWPFFGGDPGRSGHQTDGEGRPPVAPVHSLTAESERGVQTSIVVSAGQPTARILAYGTSNGRIHLQLLASGEPVGPEEGVLVDAGDPDADVFTGRGGSVTPVDTSEGDRLGQVFAVHNDDNSGGTNDLAIAQIDESSGALVQDIRLPGTRDYTISSSPVVTAPAPGSEDRLLFFVANDGTKTTLFRVPIASAGSPDATIGEATSREVTGGNPLASPTLVTLNDAAGAPTPYVAVSTSSVNTLQTFTVAGIEATPAGSELGPRSGSLGGTAQTASVPAGGGPLHVAVATPEGRTVVHSLLQNGAEQTLTSAGASRELEGAPAPGLAVTGGRVAVTTSANLYLLDRTRLALLEAASPAPLVGGTGFVRTTAAAAGALLHVTRDNGQQLALRLRDGEPLARGAFRQSRGNRDATAAYGQPAISAGFVAHASDRGAFVYRTRCGNSIAGTPLGETLPGTSAGDDVRALGGADRINGRLGDDCVEGGRGDDRISGGAGVDKLEGGVGDDRLWVGGGGSDTVSCGRGRDVVRADRLDRVQRDCERVRRTG